MRRIIPVFAIAALGLLGASTPARAGDPPPVSLELRDAPLRAALEQLFNAAGQQYQIASDVRGFATLKVREQPFDMALKLLLRSATEPLTYKIENGVYLVSVRRTPPPVLDSLPTFDPPTETGRKFEFVPLTYLDPKALEPLLGPMLEVEHFRRWRQQPTGAGGNNGAPGQQSGRSGNQSGPSLGPGMLGQSGGGFLSGPGGLMLGSNLPGGLSGQSGGPRG